MKVFKLIWMKAFKNGQDHWEVAYYTPSGYPNTYINMIHDLMFESYVELEQTVIKYEGQMFYSKIADPMIVFDDKEKAQLFIDEQLEPRLMMYLLLTT